MKLLFIHPNMPGQYKHLARAFGENPENQVVFITKPRPLEKCPKGVRMVSYVTPREPSPETHRYLLPFERAVLQGQEVWRVCKKLKITEGFIPDVIVAHPGWGDTLLLKELFPDTPQLSYIEFYYSSFGADVNFDPNEQASEDDLARIHIKNATNLFGLAQMDHGLSPTFWQMRQNPKAFWPKISVLHDGVDTDMCVPKADVSVTLPNGVRLTREDEVITYVARNFEPYRGFPTFMQAAEQLLRERPNCHIIAIGGDEVSYGKPAPAGTNYREIWTKKMNFVDPNRIHFVGMVPYEQLIAYFQLSRAHIYLTYPFVLSWSFMESMACGALVIGSRTPPVQEVITHEANGLLVDFFSPQEVVAAVHRVFADKGGMQPLRDAARHTIVERYALKDVLPLHQALVLDVAAGRTKTAEDILLRNRRLHAGIVEELGL
jgi:glycosyltransferase involved in cell wall biosynthesis